MSIRPVDLVVVHRATDGRVKRKRLSTARVYLGDVNKAIDRAYDGRDHYTHDVVLVRYNDGLVRRYNT